MDEILRVVDWDKNFENSKTRTIQNLRWVPIPNKHDSDGYTQIVDHPDGPAHYACWIVITQVASKCQPRGRLVRASGEPYDCESLSRKTRMPQKLFEAAIPRLIVVGWVERISSDGSKLEQACQEGDGQPSGDRQEGDGQVPQKGREEKGREGNKLEATNVASTPVEPEPHPAEFNFPLSGGKLWDLPTRKLDEYLATHADRFDVKSELRKARQWLMDNNDRRPKATKGMATFLTRWLNRTSDKARPTMLGSTVASNPGPDAVYNAETGEIVTPMRRKTGDD